MNIWLTVLQIICRVAACYTAHAGIQTEGGTGHGIPLIHDRAAGYFSGGIQTGNRLAIGTDHLAVLVYLGPVIGTGAASAIVASGKSIILRRRA